MNLGDLRHQFRVMADDLSQPYLWSDEEIALYASDAESQAAERARLIYDAIDPEFTSLVVRSPITSYDLSPAVILVDAVWQSESGQRLNIIDPHQALLEVGALDSRTGNPERYAQIGRSICVLLPPDKPTRLRMAVYRRPARPLVNKDDRPEIPVFYHLGLIDWMLFRAYSKRDSDAQDTQRADRHAALFSQTFGELESANVRRKQFEKRAHTTRFNPEWGGGPMTRGRRR